MSFIRLKNIHKENNRISFVFCYSQNLQIYFAGQPLVIEYSENISAVPDAVCAIPFVCNVLPIVWLTDSTLELAELDQDFYDCIPEFKKGYIQMFPDVDFRGVLSVTKIVDCTRSGAHGSVVFFSGGLDATTTLFRHMTEKPELLSVWGADIAFDNERGWNVLKAALSEAAQFYKLKHVVVHSSFRCFDREDNLENDFSQYLHDGWWHGVKHGIGLIGHAAPYMWLAKKKTAYIASSFCPDDGKIICASDPSIDNFVRFCGCNVCHDGFELSRQAKTQLVVDYQKKHEISQIPLHVCWESNDGKNCCKCEKCFRTIVSIFLAGGDPRMCGFNISPATWYALYDLLALKYEYAEHIRRYWQGLQKEFLKKWPLLKDTPEAQRLKWLLTFDFEHPDRNLSCRIYKVKRWMINAGKRLLHPFPFAEKCVRLLLHPQRIKDVFQKYWSRLRLWKYLTFPLGRKIFLLGVPVHDNIGDSAIVLAEKKMLLQLGFEDNCIKEISIGEFQGNTSLIRAMVSKDDIVTGLGGGNMGDVWFEEEEFRRLFLRMFQNEGAVIFPQTIFYTATEKGKAEEKKSIAIYNNHRFLLVSREQFSYKKMCELYPLAPRLLTPDIVLSTTIADYGIAPCLRKGILLCLRNDAEHILSASDRVSLMASANKTGEDVIQTDMYSGCGATRQNRMRLVREKMQEFASAKLVITDRLHGMIFSAIAETPCIVFSNHNYKIRGSYEWIKYLPYIKFAENVEEAKKFIPILLKMRDCKFDNTPLMPYFDKLKELISERIK